jgi:hypothetical protein
VFEKPSIISGGLPSVGKSSREALISRESTKIVEKLSVNILRYVSSSEDIDSKDDGK